MPGTLIRRRSLVVAVVAAAGMLGACGLIDRTRGPATCTHAWCGLVDWSRVPGAIGTPGDPVAPAPPPQVDRWRNFIDPKVGGHFVDLCYAEGSCREQQQIDTFCQQQGYDEAIGSYIRNTAIAETNVRLGDESVCRSTGSGNCHHVASVTCQRTN